ncbi:MAG: hypothetical protein QXM37_04325, partial [Candidatus Bathyarchaeia archaeon]
LICHLADQTDSRLNGEILNAAAYLVKKAVGEELQGLTAKEAFEIIQSKTAEGWDALPKTVEKIKRRRERRKT